MPGWSEYLADSASLLIHLCIIGLSGRRWAQTEGGRFVRVREARAIDAQLKHPPPANKNPLRVTKVKVSGIDYMVDWERTAGANSGGVMRAWRTLTSSPGVQREVVLARSVSNYIIVGVCAGNRETECLDAVRHIADHVTTLGFQDDPNADVYGQIGGRSV